VTEAELEKLAANAHSRRMNDPAYAAKMILQLLTQIERMLEEIDQRLKKLGI